MDPEEFDPVPGVVEQVAPLVRRILAPNPSPMTFRGTNSYLVGEGDITLIDPGPESPEHYRALLDALASGERISSILVTHSHIDHSPLARAISDETGAPVAAFGDCVAGRSDTMKQLAQDGMSSGGEGVDQDFRPDITLEDGEELPVSGGSISAIWTPGHFCNHMSFAFQDIVFTGDTIMGWASTMVSPPDGDLTQFRDSVARLADRESRLFLPGHGAPISNPRDRAECLLNHRRGRETEILDQLGIGAETIGEITAKIYQDTPSTLWPAAARNVFAHLIDLHEKGTVEIDGRISTEARFFLKI